MSKRLRRLRKVLYARDAILKRSSQIGELQASLGLSILRDWARLDFRLGIRRISNSAKKRKTGAALEEKTRVCFMLQKFELG
jgi:hypothetical protein